MVIVPEIAKMKRRIWTGLLKLVISCIVLVGVFQAVRKAMNELDRQDHKLTAEIARIDEELLQISDSAEEERLMDQRRELQSQRVSVFSIHPGWLTGSVLATMIGMFPAGVFWLQTLRSFGYRLPVLPTLATYFLGHLGKYVPGKAMVVIIRAAGLRKMQVKTSTSVVSIFVETLVLMAVGGALGGIAIALLKPPLWIIAGACVLVLASALPTLPPVFRWVVEWLAKKRTIDWDESTQRGLHWQLLGLGWVENAIGWFGMALALWLLLHGIAPSDAAIEWYSLQVACACLAASTLSVVAGFASMLPGGAGVRELVITIVLAPLFGVAPALASAVWMRLVALLAELLWIVVTRLVIAAWCTMETPSQ